MRWQDSAAEAIQPRHSGAMQGIRVRCQRTIPERRLIRLEFPAIPRHPFPEGNPKKE
jgi:hypothetical protein